MTTLRQLKDYESNLHQSTSYILNNSETLFRGLKVMADQVKQLANPSIVDVEAEFTSVCNRFAEKLGYLNDLEQESKDAWKVITQAQQDGVCDVEYIAQVIQPLEQRTLDISQQIYDTVGELLGVFKTGSRLFENLKKKQGVQHD